MKTSVSKFPVSVEAVESERFGQVFLHALASSTAYRAAKKLGLDEMVSHGFMGIGKVQLKQVSIKKSKLLDGYVDMKAIAVIEYKWR